MGVRLPLPAPTMIREEPASGLVLRIVVRNHRNHFLSGGDRRDRYRACDHEGFHQAAWGLVDRRATADRSVVGATCAYLAVMRMLV